MHWWPTWVGWTKSLTLEDLSISCENGKLVITPDAERAAMAEAENAFMEREMASLKKKFEVEKSKLHAQFVAEREARYGVCEVTV